MSQFIVLARINTRLTKPNFINFRASKIQMYENQAKIQITHLMYLLVNEKITVFSMLNEYLLIKKMKKKC